MDTDTAWKNNLSAKPVEPAAKDYVYEFVMCKKGVRLKKYKGKNAYVRIPEIYKGIFRLPQAIKKSGSDRPGCPRHPKRGNARRRRSDIHRRMDGAPGRYPRDKSHPHQRQKNSVFQIQAPA